MLCKPPLDLLQLQVYIRILPAEPCVQPFSDTSYTLGDFSRTVPLLHNRPYADHAAKEADKDKSDIESNQIAKILLGHAVLRAGKRLRDLVKDAEQHMQARAMRLQQSAAAARPREPPGAQPSHGPPATPPAVAASSRLLPSRWWR